MRYCCGGTANDVTKTFTYNPANQIVTQTTSNDAYAFTGLANGSTTSTTNGLNELATVGGVTATNDTNANLTYAGTGTFSYDVENKLLHVTTGGVSANSIYDPLARLTQLTGTAVSDRTFVTDPIAGDAVVAEHSSGGALQGRYVFVDVNEPIVSYDNAGNRTWLAADERGSIIAAVDASGAASAIYSYDEYGVPAASNAGRFGYTGQVRLPEVVETGLYYYKNRMYLSPLGRFPQPDPIGYAGDGPNLYAYVLNDPVNFSDPLGLDRAINIQCPGPTCDIVTGTREPPQQPLPASVEFGAGPNAVRRPPPPKPKSSSKPKPKPAYCTNPNYQRGQALKNAGAVAKMGSTAFFGYGTLQALFYGSMTEGPGAAISIPTFLQGAELYGYGSTISTAGSGLQCRAGSSAGCREVAGAVSLSGVRAIAPVNAIGGLIADLVTDALTDATNGSDPCK